MKSILIISRQPDTIAALCLLLKGVGYKFEIACTPQLALASLSRGYFQLAILDVDYEPRSHSGNDELNLIANIRNTDPSMPVVVMTARGDDEVAVEALRYGARDFVEKPWDNARLLMIIKTQVLLSEGEKGRQLINPA